MKIRQRVNGQQLGTVWSHQDGVIHFSSSREGEDAAEATARVADVIEVEPGVYSVLIDNRSYQLRLEHTHYGTFVQAGPWRIQLEAESRGSTRGPQSGGGPAKILSAMPGRVVRVLVSEQQAVEPGEGLFVLEAMKMQNEIPAPRAGVVHGLSVKEGDVVAAGIVLCRVE